MASSLQGGGSAGNSVFGAPAGTYIQGSAATCSSLTMPPQNNHNVAAANSAGVLSASTSSAQLSSSSSAALQPPPPPTANPNCFNQNSTTNQLWSGIMGNWQHPSGVPVSSSQAAAVGAAGGTGAPGVHRPNAPALSTMYSNSSQQQSQHYNNNNNSNRNVGNKFQQQHNNPSGNLNNLHLTQQSSISPSSSSSSSSFNESYQRFGNSNSSNSSNFNEPYSYSSPVDPNPSLYIHNVPKDATEEELRDLFSAFGAVERIRLKVNQKIGPQALYAFVTFQSTEEAQTALVRLNGFEMRNRKLRIEFQRSRVDDEKQQHQQYPQQQNSLLDSGPATASNVHDHRGSFETGERGGNRDRSVTRGTGDFQQHHGGSRNDYSRGGNMDRRKRGSGFDNDSTNDDGRDGGERNSRNSGGGPFKRARYYEAKEEYNRFNKQHGDNDERNNYYFSSSNKSGCDGQGGNKYNKLYSMDSMWESNQQNNSNSNSSGIHENTDQRMMMMQKQQQSLLQNPPVSSPATASASNWKQSKISVIFICDILRRIKPHLFNSSNSNSNESIDPHHQQQQFKYNTPQSLISGQFVPPVAPAVEASGVLLGADGWPCAPPTIPAVPATPALPIMSATPAVPAMPGVSTVSLNMNVLPTTTTTAAGRTTTNSNTEPILSAAAAANNIEFSSNGSLLNSAKNLIEMNSNKNASSNSNKWVGVLARNNKRKVPIEITAIEGSLEPYINSNVNLLNILHRSSFDDIAKKPVGSVCLIRPAISHEVPESGAVAVPGTEIPLTPQKREIIRKSFASHLEYLTLKGRSGVITLSDKKQLCLIPPGVPLFDALKKNFEISGDEQQQQQVLLGVLTNSYSLVPNNNGSSSAASAAGNQPFQNAEGFRNSTTKDDIMEQQQQHTFHPPMQGPIAADLRAPSPAVPRNLNNFTSDSVYNQASKLPLPIQHHNNQHQQHHQSIPPAGGFPSNSAAAPPHHMMVNSLNPTMNSTYKPSLYQNQNL